MTSLRITEIFHSLQGEARTVGLPTAFVRLTGCPLRCQYCDSEYAFHGGEQQALEGILRKVAERKVRYVTVTGGEPLAQPGCRTLCQRLSDEGYHVSLETSGAMDISGIDERVSVVLDLKTPGSKESSRNLYENIELLKKIDQVKFVICDRQDYEWARFKVQELRLMDRVSDVLFSASHEELSSTELAKWILEDELEVRLQVQLHKILWGDKQGV
ncbi:MAG: 7-carboxy-7-deazaguanine synthase QueE [Pseudomonadales bacterium]|nr:7-carboxy-7-deazaguanine synthase QueE [Pseudomonadales bacterium]MBO6563577.1 7-carboxy-7-deazaguanine synthase QueE [Pseudomonadales bacterium]MBO6594366.1 7-carboxy-7-deazaguanine synthase QueE [Pseudomonadales bacterium]MBO6655542.1 7-carboxy-7-deazaguanine synthase QueE [Pseudomonadales bacterium]MBO6700867.1 7-carboxy-7-deazaguanine synthase QueE [Pseudomonadales bacterium]